MVPDNLNAIIYQYQEVIHRKWGKHSQIARC